MLNLVFLPATASGDVTYGTIPGRIDACPNASIHRVEYPGMVWYNEAIRREAIAQIAALKADPVVLVGFSKSGLGAWNIARTSPGRIAATLIFDAPMARETLPPWGTAPFYADDAEWRRDLPLRTIAPFKASIEPDHALVLISGASFHDEMVRMSQALTDAGCSHQFLPRPDVKHHWNSGWIDEGLCALPPAVLAGTRAKCSAP